MVGHAGGRDTMPRGIPRRQPCQGRAGCVASARAHCAVVPRDRRRARHPHRHHPSGTAGHSDAVLMVWSGTAWSALMCAGAIDIQIRKRFYSAHDGSGSAHANAHDFSHTRISGATGRLPVVCRGRGRDRIRLTCGASSGGNTKLQREWTNERGAGNHRGGGGAKRRWMLLTAAGVVVTTACERG